MRMKSCIYPAILQTPRHRVQRPFTATVQADTHLLSLNHPRHVGLLGRVHLREVHGEEVVGWVVVSHR